LTPTLIHLELRETHRLIPSRFPPVGILDVIASPEDLPLIFELEGWTNDRISAELGILPLLPAADWVVGQPHASVIMAAFCHPRPGGGRFHDEDRGAWYAALDLQTAIAETVHHRTLEFHEIGVFDARVQMRQYLADFDAAFHDIRADTAASQPFHAPDSYLESQALARDLRTAGSSGIAYRSVRRAGGTCLVCFRPHLIRNVQPAAHFEYTWAGSPVPTVRQIGAGS